MTKYTQPSSHLISEEMGSQLPALGWNLLALTHVGLGSDVIHSALFAVEAISL